jgi:hypothetical protein
MHKICRCFLRLAVAGVALVASVGLIYAMYFPKQLRPSLIRGSTPNFSAVAEMDALTAIGRVVDTPSCVIPDYDPYNPVISRTLADPSPDFVWCNTSWPMLTDVVGGRFVKVNLTLKLRLRVSFCEYQEVSQCGLHPQLVPQINGYLTRASIRSWL